ncbi:MAG TPA: PQQ-dependent sugar dehydrogenase [Salinimicrobium sp.]|nr:PQQ-dependent sugar dehydrogenase [Salinimicrobium sp.]
MRLPVTAFCMLLLLNLSACGQNENKASTEEVNDKETPSIAATYGHEVIMPHPDILWGMDFLPDGSMLITEKEGNIIHFINGEKIPVEGVPEILVQGQGGLMDIAMDPKYEENGWIYFTYASSEGEGDGGNTAVMRAKLENNELVNKEKLYKAVPNSTAGQHFGSRIAFKDGYLFFSVGDRGNREENPQDITRDGGKIYRLNRDGSIPEDNPFTDVENAKKAIFSYGHRNPQGMTKNPETGEIWVHEHGPQGGDEINIIQKGANYGWPLVTYGINYNGTSITEETSGPEFEDPIKYWVPSIAPSGMTFVTSDKYPELKGDLLVGSLKFMYLEHLTVDGNEVSTRKKLLEGIGRVRDVKQAPDGNIYLSVEGVGIVKLINENQENKE